MYKTIINLGNLTIDEREIIEKALENISKKDYSFKYSIIGCSLIIYSSNKDTAYKRGFWIINKFEILKRKFSTFKVKNEV